MNNNLSLSPELRAAAGTRGFTLNELMISVALIGLCAGLITGIITGVATLAAKNYSLNDSGLNLRQGMQRMTQAVEDAVEITDVANFDGTAFTSVASGSWGNAVRFMSYLPGTFYILDPNKTNTMQNPPSEDTTTIAQPYLPVGATSLKVSYSGSASYTFTGSERLFILYPVRRETASDGPAGGTLGLGIQAGTLSGGAGTIKLKNALTLAKSNESRDINATVRAYNAAYLIHESAFVIRKNADGNSCSLYYMDDTSKPTKLSLVNGSIATTQPPDIYRSSQAAPTTAGASFCLRSDPTGEQVLQILLPISSPDFSRRLVSGGRTAAAAYNFYISANLNRRSLQAINTQ